MSIELEGNVWMTLGGQHLGGPDRVALLASIADRAARGDLRRRANRMACRAAPGRVSWRGRVG
jgi:hypothetical protein